MQRRVTGHSPEPWALVPSDIPYYSWLMGADSSCVCIGFGNRDAPLLLAAPQLRAVCAHLVAWMEGELAGGATLSEIADEARAALAGLE